MKIGLLYKVVHTDDFYKILENPNIEILDVSRSFGLESKEHMKKFLNYLSKNSSLIEISIEGLKFRTFFFNIFQENDIGRYGEILEGFELKCKSIEIFMMNRENSFSFLMIILMIDNFINFSNDLTFFKSILALPKLKVLEFINNNLSSKGLDLLFSDLKSNFNLEELSFNGKNINFI